MAENDPKEPLDLEIYWDALGVRRHPTAEPSEAAEPATSLTFGNVPAGSLVIGTSRHRILVTIQADGTVEYGADYKPDEAALVFWEAMGRARLGAEDRILVIQHMEAIMTRLGAQDMETERLRRAAAEEPDPLRKATLEQSAGLAVRRLELIMNQVIELGRALVRRPEVVAPPVPQEVPRSVRENPNSAYQGQEGLPGPTSENER
jgi:hypothetical protein